MLFGALDNGELECRRTSDGAYKLRGKFPYNRPAVLSDGGRSGRPRKEVVAPRAFGYRVDDPHEDIHLLFGHDYGKPLASKSTGTLSFLDTASELTFDATIAPEVAATSHGTDALALIGSGLAVGISPGFRIPPTRAVADAERIEEEPHDPGRGMHGAIIRTILQALLYELSIVTRPAYSHAQIEMRNWTPTDRGALAPMRALSRWRA